MNNLFQKLVLISGASLVSILALTSPGNAAVFYDLEFFDESGELAGTGEFSHEEEPFEDTIELCIVEPICGSNLLEIEAEDNFFLLESFFSTVRGISSLSSRAENDNLFWRPFDDELVAGFDFCQSAGCIANTGSFFFIGAWAFRFRGVADVVMTANEWRVSGGSTPVDGDGNPVFPDGSGTWTATRRTSIPEPASTLGLMAVSAIAVGSKLKRKKH
ncbi:MAG: PEP-CTERM sorting domain-containing protein [Microcoleaceae cyanobacterium]